MNLADHAFESDEVEVPEASNETISQSEEAVVYKKKWTDTLLPLHLMFLACALLFIILGSYLQHFNFNMGILATEFGMLVVPVLLYMKIRKLDVKTQFKFKIPRMTDFLKVAIAGVFLVPFVGLMNSVVNLWLVYGLHIQAPTIPTEKGMIGPLISLAIVAMTPGFCEEFFFRGLLLTEYEKKMNLFQAALLSALLFGMFHYNIMNFFGPVVLGLVFAWTMQVTGSILLAMFGHFINNAFAVAMLYATSGLDQTESLKGIEAMGNFWPIMVVILLIGLIAIALPCLTATLYFLKSIRKNYLKVGDEIKVNQTDYKVACIDEGVLLLEETNAEFLDDEEEGPSSITLDYRQLYRNNRVVLKTKHWDWSMPNYQLRISEWWPIIICAIMYIGVNALSLTIMIQEAPF